VIGIASTLAAYRLIHHLNKQLPSAFIKQRDLPYYLSEKETLLLPLYHYYHPTSKNNWFILANNTAGRKKAIPAFRNVDFFMLIDSVLETEALDDITSRMRKAQGIQMAINIRPSTVKNLELLHSDLEMHLMELQKEKKAGATLWQRNRPISD
jgi:hypothetical protein